MPADDRNLANKRTFAELECLSDGVDAGQSKKAKTLAAERSSSTNDNEHPSTSKRKFTPEDIDDDLTPPSKRLASERPSDRTRIEETNIHDIPKELLVEILCRLPCVKSVFRCKCVSNSWRSLTSDPYFVGRFLWLQRENQTLIPGKIIDNWVNELLTPYLFAKFKSFEVETKDGRQQLQVVATWNDLVLCRRNDYDFQDDGQYYICNPRTMQLATLPVPDEIHERGKPPPVGFICEPYYREQEDAPDDNSDRKDEDDQEDRNVIKIDPEYKCKVVRILPPDDCSKLCFEFKIQVFSSETGQWKDSLVPCPRGFDFSKIDMESYGAFAINGMLYWIPKEDGDLLGLGPLMINNKSTSTSSNSIAANGDSGYLLHVIKLVRQELEDADLRTSPYHLQANRGRLQLVRAVANESRCGVRLLVWELEKEELEQMAVQGGGELGQKHQNRYDLLDKVKYQYLQRMRYLGSDPNDLDTCFVCLTDEKDDGDGPRKDIASYKCNIHTGEHEIVSKEKEEHSEMEMDPETEYNQYILYGPSLQIMVPWWPTPKPTIRGAN